MRLGGSWLWLWMCGTARCTYGEGRGIVVYVWKRYVGVKKVVARTGIYNGGGVVRGEGGIRTSWCIM